MDWLCFTDYEIVLRKMYVFWCFWMLGDEKIVFSSSELQKWKKEMESSPTLITIPFKLLVKNH
jgi:hypothetical protein